MDIINVSVIIVSLPLFGIPSVFSHIYWGLSLCVMSSPESMIAIVIFFLWASTKFHADSGSVYGVNPIAFIPHWPYFISGVFCSPTLIVAPASAESPPPNLNPTISFSLGRIPPIIPNSFFFFLFPPLYKGSFGIISLSDG